MKLKKSIKEPEDRYVVLIAEMYARMISLNFDKKSSMKMY